MLFNLVDVYQANTVQLLVCAKLALKIAQHALMELEPAQAASPDSL
jgi:hypothetical protein